MGVLRFKGNKGHNEVASHATPLPTTVAGLPGIGHDTLTVSSSAVGLANIPTNAIGAMITVEDADIRYWIDGSDPTTAEGHLAYKDDVIKLSHPDQVAKFRALAVSSDAKLQITYY